MRNRPKYSLPEFERRWLVSRERMPVIEGSAVRRIEDRYFLGTRMRLRRVDAVDAPPIFKLGRKYERSHGDEPEAVVTIYLDAAEHAWLAGMPAAVAIKNRYAIAGGSIDVYERPAHAFAVFELEFADRAAMSSYHPPAFVAEEITGRSEFSGYALADHALRGLPPPGGGRLLPARLEPGADLRAALQALVEGTGAGGAFVVSGMGSLSAASLRFAGRESAAQLSGDLEILALSGTLSRDGVHLHMSVADAEGRVHGGHVGHGCTIRTTAEVLLVLLDDWSLGRVFDPATGYRELTVGRRRQLGSE